jgi:hypothetical protein
MSTFIMSHVKVTIDRILAGNEIYCTPLHRACDYTSQCHYTHTLVLTVPCTVQRDSRVCQSSLGSSKHLPGQTITLGPTLQPSAMCYSQMTVSILVLQCPQNFQFGFFFWDFWLLHYGLHYGHSFQLIAGFLYGFRFSYHLFHFLSYDDIKLSAAVFNPIIGQ